MKKMPAIALMLCLFASFPGFAQQLAHVKPSSEIGIYAGISDYMGDMAPDIVWKESHPAFGVFYKYNANGYFSYQGSLNYGSISGNDSDYKTLAPRGMKFSSTIWEISGQITFNLFNFGSRAQRGTRRFTPYVFTGLSLYHFDPMAQYQGTWYHLHDLNTEGQNTLSGAPKQYAEWQFAVPVGGGIKLNVAQYVNLALFTGYRATFTQYLDDVGGVYADKDALRNLKGEPAAFFSDPTGIGEPGKQRGNHDKTDWFIFSGFTISYIIPPPVCPAVNDL